MKNFCRRHCAGNGVTKVLHPQANSAVRTIISKCIVCRRFNAKAGRQKNGRPAKRQATTRSTTLYQQRGLISCQMRKEPCQAFFSCLTVRAVHIERAHSLDIDSCIHTICQFICTRGQVKIIHSDSGTNFVAAERDVHEALRNLNQTNIQKIMTEKATSGFSTPQQLHTKAVYGKEKSVLQESPELRATAAVTR